MKSSKAMIFTEYYPSHFRRFLSARNAAISLAACICVCYIFFVYPLGSNPKTLATCINEVSYKHSRSVWTLVTDDVNYAHGAVHLLKSLRQHTLRNDYETIVLELKEKPLSQQSSKMLTDAGWKLCRVDRIAPTFERKTFARFRDQFTKLQLWKMTEFESVLYFDSDALIVQNIDALLSVSQQFEAKQAIGVARDIYDGVWQDGFNMGVFAIKPNRTEFERLIRIKDDPSFKYRVDTCEQGFLNAVYNNSWYDIGFENNANLAVYSQLPDFWLEREGRIKVIHYTMSKPWNCKHVYQPVCKKWRSYLPNSTE